MANQKDAAETISDCAKTHPYLYHYTSEAGMLGIVGSNALWGTLFSDLNDSKEIHEVRSPLSSELAVYMQPLVEEFGERSHRNRKIVSKLGGRQRAAQDLARKWVNNLYSVTFEPDETKRNSLCCITSFCSHARDQEYEREHGLLSQWRGYGANGGFCLIFNTAKLEALLEVERERYFFAHVALHEANYRHETEPVAGLFPDLFAFSKEIVGTLMGGGDPDVGKIYEPFVTAATTTKHRGFYEEREVRIVTFPATQVAVDKIKHNPLYSDRPLKEAFSSEKDGQVRSHISLFGKESPALPIERIIVGPSKRQESNAKTAQGLVGETVRVTKSATPFIG